MMKPFSSNAHAIIVALICASSIAACTSSAMPGPSNPGSNPMPGPTSLPQNCSQSATPTPSMNLCLVTGFKIALVSNNVSNARFLAFAPNGDLIVSEPNNGAVVAIPPGSAVNAAPNIIASGLSRPHGLAFNGNDLYIGTQTGLSVIRNYPTNTTVQTLYSGLPQPNNDHNNRSLAIASNGTVYLSSGSDCNICSESDAKYATIMSMDLNGQNPQIYASGVRNGSGLAFDQSGQLWMVVNQRDDLQPDHTNLPTDEFDKVIASGNYGWPTCYPDLVGNREPNPDSPVSNPSCAGQVRNTQPLQAHSAPLGIVFYNGSMFPAQYRGGAFVAFHGSWDRSPPTGYKVVFVPFSAGTPSAPTDFVAGWLTPSNSVTGRPVGLAVAPDGSLYISDDSNGYIYRVTYGP
jgi:glucose/arabinose dehydrogenase